MTYYSEYFGVKEDYVSCMTLADINKTPETWLSFYPHESFLAILRQLLKCLEGGTKTLWITGAYGTGKSFASLVLQKLFKDDERRVLEWLKRREAEIPSAVRERLLSRLKTNVLVVYDVNSDGVDAKNQFLMRMQKGITKALRDKGHCISTTSKIEDMIERIRQDECYFFAKRDEMQSQLPYLNPSICSADELAKQMNDRNVEGGLINDSLKVLEARDIFLGLNAEDFLSWVKKCLEENGITKLVYLWDEFSSFMERNRSQLKTLEQLAEAAQQGLFYFVPVTHTEITSYLASGSESAKKANNRFVFKKIDLPNETALKLMAEAFVINQETKREWQIERDQLWYEVKGVVENYMLTNNAGIELNDFKKILPLHPMTAFLLKHLSVSTVGSNQRSMFDFLNSDDFKEFIRNGGLEEKGLQYLTVDYLWNYFVERDDLGNDTRLHETRAEYLRRENELQPDEKRVFKSVLLFDLMEQIQGTQHPLLMATVENITRCFEGDVALVDVDVVLRNLEQKHCFTIYDGRCARFHDRTDSIELQERTKALQGKFGELVLDSTKAELVKYLKDVNHGNRYEIRVVRARNLSTSSITRNDSFGSEGNRILLLFIFAQDAEEQLLVSERANVLAKHFNDHRMLFIHFPDVYFCCDDANNWEKFIENNARLLLLADNSNSKKVYEIPINDAKKDWSSKVVSTSNLNVYIPNRNGEPYLKKLTWNQLRTSGLQEYAKQMFESYTDDLCGYNVSAFKAPQALKSWAKAGICFDKFEKHGPFGSVVKKWQNNGISGEMQWFEANCNHPLTQIRDFCKRRLDNTVGKGKTCSIRKLYIDLQRRPFGLLSVPHTAFVLGFVLKSWLHGKRMLQWTDNVHSMTLEPETLAEIIETVIKDDGKNNIKNEKFICRLSNEEKAFIEMSSVIFGFKAQNDGTVESALAAISARLMQISNQVPLWVLPKYIYLLDNQNAEAMENVINSLCEANSISSRENTTIRSDKVKEIGKILLENPGLAKAMSKYINPNELERAFELYVDNAKPELCEAAKRMDYPYKAYYEMVKRGFVSTTSWLWKQNDVDSILEEVLHRILCSEKIRELANNTGYIGFEDALEILHHSIFQENRVPTETWVKKHPALRNFFELIDRSSLTGNEVHELDVTLKQHGEIVRNLFFDMEKIRQLEAMYELFGDRWPKEAKESRELYLSLPKGLSRESEASFIERGREEIERYNRCLLSNQVKKAWSERTKTDSPDELSRQYVLPAECFLNLENARIIIDAINNPSEISSKRLEIILNDLSSEDWFLNEAAARERFLRRILPSGYMSIEFEVRELCVCMRKKLGHSPNEWLTNESLAETVDSFIKKQYCTASKGKAANRVNELSDAEAKRLLLRLIEELPDAGFFVLR